MSIVDRFTRAVNAFVSNPVAPAETRAVYDNGSQFSPGQPLKPQHPAKPPFANQLKVGYNLNITPRGEEPRLLPFVMLRSIAESFDLVSICIQMMIDQVVGDEWDIVVADKNDRDNREEDVKKVKEFFRRPDKVHMFNDWFKPLMYDTLTCDCPCIFKRHTRGGKLYSLEYVDGTTIKPLIDAYGRVPQPPEAAYQQILYGSPFGSSNVGVAKQIGFTTNDISYRPRYPRTWTPYGYSPIEKMLVKINIALRRDDYHLKYFTDGTTPDGGIYAFDNQDMTVDQIEQFATLYNELMSGDLHERLKLKFLPKGQYISTKQFSYDVKVDEWMARIVALAFGVNPQEFIILMNRSTAQMQDQQQTDIGLKPLENFFAEWFTDIIQTDLGFPHLKFKYVDEKSEDAQLSVDRDKTFVESGILSVDTVRSTRGLPPLTDLKDGVPPYVKVGNDIIFITPEYIEAKKKAQILALTAGNVQGGNQQNTEVKLREAGVNQGKKPTSAEEPPKEDNPPTETKPKSKKQEKPKKVLDEIDCFERFALRRLNKNGTREFQSEVIPQPLMKSISGQLTNATTPEQVKKIFRDAKGNIVLVDINSQNLAFAFSQVRNDIEDLIDDLDPEDERRQDKGKWKKYILALLLGAIDFKTGIIGETIHDMLTYYATDTVNEAAEEIERQFGEKISADVIDATIKDAVAKRTLYLRDELSTATGNFLTSELYGVETDADIKETLHDAYALSFDRAETIAAVEFGLMTNMVRVMTAKATKSVKGVLVSDGMDHDEACLRANGQTWPLDYAMDHLKQHPDCVRAFTYVGELNNEVTTDD